MPDSDSSHKRKKDKSKKKKRKRSESRSRERKSLKKSKPKRHQTSDEELPEEKQIISSAISDEAVTSSGKSPTPEGSKSPEIYGPSLPPKLLETKNEPRERILGPTLPPGFQPPEPTVQSTDSNDDDIDFVGPLPPGGSNALTETELQLEERALQIKLGKLDPNAGSHGDAKVREEWMLELPEVNSLKNLGPTNRKFRAKEGPDFSDRSSWTNTPQNKEKKPKDSKDKAEEKYIKERDKEQERMARKHGKKHKRDKSLLELHQKSLEKQKDKSKDNTERRPFSRDMDLQPNRFDAARTASAINKAQLLNDRFSTGKAKYL